MSEKGFDINGILIPPFCMSSSLFQPESSLKQKDFYLLSNIFRREIESMLPVMGRVVFHGPAWEKEEKNRRTGAGCFKDQPLPPTISQQSGIVDGKLIVQLEVEGGEKVAAVIEGIDPGLLGKMAQEWVMEFRESVQARLEKKRRDFTDPVTGLYNTRLLLHALDQSCQEGSSKALFLVCTKNKTRKVTDQLPKTVQTGRLIDGTTSDPLFYLGCNIFGLLRDNLSRRESLKTAHRLLNRLKREGLQSVHIGISIQENDQEQREAGTILHECWRALETAERRGTFSLCEAAYLTDSGILPFAPPRRQVVSALRGKWRGIKRFGLILVCVEGVPAETTEAFKLDATVTDILPEKMSFTPVSSCEGYIFAPGLTVAKILNLAKGIKKEIEKKYKKVSVAMGISHWPLLNYSKTRSMVNCRKALMHGRFFGPGSVTAFDHVSLNVSGDYFFDEGDYRQAVHDYRTGVLLEPDDENLLNSLGVALTSLNRTREAIVYFSRVLALDPDNFMALVNMGFAQRILGNEDKAVQCLEKASRHGEFTDSTVFEELSLQLAQLYLERESHGNALALLRRLEQKKSGRQGGSLLLMLGEACAGTGKYREAVSYLQKAVRINPHDAQSLSLLGKLYAQENQGDEIALSLCQKAVCLDDASWKNWFHLALVQFRMGLLDEAGSAVRESLRLNRNGVEALCLAEKIYRQAGEFRNAKNIQNRLIKTAATNQQAVKAMLN